ncbi:MAG: hypothetical protein GX316_03870 [Firmicutes bacterium]|nr:hypothetical protein [Bacillota bacterium]
MYNRRCNTVGQDERIKVLKEAIKAIAEHPTLEVKAKRRGIEPLQFALDKLLHQTDLKTAQ